MLHSTIDLPASNDRLTTSVPSLNLMCSKYWGLKNYRHSIDMFICFFLWMYVYFDSNFTEICYFWTDSILPIISWTEYGITSPRWSRCSYEICMLRNSDVIMSTMASQIIDVSMVWSTVCSGENQRIYLLTVWLIWHVFFLLLHPCFWKLHDNVGLPLRVKVHDVMAEEREWTGVRGFCPYWEKWYVILS